MSQLTEELRAIAPELSPRLQLLLMGIVQEIDRLDGEIAALADETLGDRRYSIRGGITDEHVDQPGPDAGVSGSSRATAVADHYARL